MDNDLEPAATETTESDGSFWLMLTESVGAFVGAVFGGLSS